MIKNFTIKNFRGFKELKLEGLNRLNLITGRNNVGKTALLEALTLMLSSNNIAGTIEIDKFRGISKKGADAEEIWGWLFYQHKLSEKIELHLENETHQNIIQHHITLTLETINPAITNISFEPSSNTEISIESNTTEQLLNQLRICYQNSKNENFEIKGEVSNKGVQSQPILQPFFPPSIYINNNRLPNPAESSQLFDRVVVKGKEKRIIEIIQLIEPNLVNIESLAPHGIRQLYGDMGFSTKMPLNYLGDGLNKLVSIILAMNTVAQGGYLLIDEMENGFHYSIMPLVWKILAEFAEQQNVQIIATTHSREFVRAAYETNKERVTEKKENLFGLYRLERIQNEIKSVRYTESALETSFDLLNWEVR